MIIDIKVQVIEKLKGLKVVIQSPNELLGQRLKENLLRVESQTETLLVKTSKGYEKINFSDIEMIDIYKNDIVIQLISQRKIETKGRLYKLLDELSGSAMVQVTKATILNSKEVTKLVNGYSGNVTAYMQSGNAVHVSRRYLNELKKVLSLR